MKPWNFSDEENSFHHEPASTKDWHLSVSNLDGRSWAGLMNVSNFMPWIEPNILPNYGEFLSKRICFVTARQNIAI